MLNPKVALDSSPTLITPSSKSSFSSRNHFVWISITRSLVLLTPTTNLFKPAVHKFCKHMSTSSKTRSNTALPGRNHLMRARQPHLRSSVLPPTIVTPTLSLIGVRQLTEQISTLSGIMTKFGPWGATKLAGLLETDKDGDENFEEEVEGKTRRRKGRLIKNWIIL